MNELTPIIPSDRVVCSCFDVSEATIRNYFLSEKASVEEFTRTTGATTKCAACKMDFDLLLDSIRGDVLIEEDPEARRMAVVKGQGVREFVDSGFLINREGIKTFLRVANLSNPFDDEGGQKLVPYDWKLRVIDESGKLRFKQSGVIEVGSSMTLDFAEICSVIDMGWFWIWLRPRAAGYFGSIRPQYGLLGQGWAATVHTQPHAWGNRRKAVVIRSRDGRFHTRVSLINGSTRKPARCDFVLYNHEASGEERRSVELPPNGSCLTDVDQLFVGACESMRLATLVVLSDQPTRKHILKLQPTGQYSIDHFPDEK